MMGSLRCLTLRPLVGWQIHKGDLSCGRRSQPTIHPSISKSDVKPLYDERRSGHVLNRVCTGKQAHL